MFVCRGQTKYSLTQSVSQSSGALNKMWWKLNRRQFHHPSHFTWLIFARLTSLCVIFENSLMIQKLLATYHKMFLTWCEELAKLTFWHMRKLLLICVTLCCHSWLSGDKWIVFIGYVSLLILVGYLWLPPKCKVMFPPNTISMLSSSLGTDFEYARLSNWILPSPAWERSVHLEIKFLILAISISACLSMGVC